MNRVVIIVEGQTERAVIEQVVAPYVGQRGVALHARVRGKPGHKGGVRNFDSVRKEIIAMMNQERNSYVSTFFDYYGLPPSWPGLGDSRGKTTCEKAKLVEAAMKENVRLVLKESDNVGRFLPYVQMHELEALLFSNPRIIAEAFESPGLASELEAIVRKCGGCEEINDNIQTTPSRRISKLYTAYCKGSSLNAHAPIIAKQIGMETMRQACPHFNDWLVKLEKLPLAKFD